MPRARRTCRIPSHWCAIPLCLVLLSGAASAEDWSFPIPRWERIGLYTVWLDRVPIEYRDIQGYYTVTVFLPSPSMLGDSITVDWAWDIHTFDGKDITGDGYPDVVVERYSGGVHCCYSYLVLSLGPELRVIPVPLMADPPASFADLDGDGVYEVLGWDPIFHYVYCGNPGTPWPLVILVYEPGRGYVPASPRFPEAYEARIERHTLLAEQVKRGEIGVAQDQAKCAVLHLVLDYLYSGRTDQAWEALYEYYPYPDVLEFHQAIMIRLGLSDLYVPSER